MGYLSQINSLSVISTSVIMSLIAWASSQPFVAVVGLCNTKLFNNYDKQKLLTNKSILNIIYKIRNVNVFSLKKQLNFENLISICKYHIIQILDNVTIVIKHLLRKLLLYITKFLFNSLFRILFNPKTAEGCNAPSIVTTGLSVTSRLLLPT